jgi:hypothetical protein
MLYGICKITHEEVANMSVQQVEIPGLPTFLSNSLIVPPKRRRFSVPGGRVKDKIGGNKK